MLSFFSTIRNLVRDSSSHCEFSSGQLFQPSASQSKIANDPKQSTETNKQHNDDRDFVTFHLKKVVSYQSTILEYQQSIMKHQQQIIDKLVDLSSAKPLMISLPLSPNDSPDLQNKASKQKISKGSAQNQINVMAESIFDEKPLIGYSFPVSPIESPKQIRSPPASLVKQPSETPHPVSATASVVENFSPELSTTTKHGLQSQTGRTRNSTGHNAKLTTAKRTWRLHSYDTTKIYNKGMSTSCQICKPKSPSVIHTNRDIY